MNQEIRISSVELSEDYPIADSLRSGRAQAMPMSITLAVRSTDFDFYAERLKFRDHCNLSGVTTILVDDGSPEDVSQKFKAFCDERGWRYVFLDTREKDFSLARARNAGIQAAETEWIFTDDADNIYEKDFFQRLLKEIAILDETPFDFLTIPHIYLSQEASDRIRATGELDSHVPWLLAQTFLENPRGDVERNHVLQHFAPASAMLALRRQTALMAGAYDTSFEGWGGEDRDFVYRLLTLNKQIVKPKAFEVTKKWNMNDTHVYEGWRALYRLMGDFMGRKGFYAYHLYHDWNAWRTPEGSNNNRDMAAERALFYHEKKKIPCIADHSRPRDVIIGFNPFIADSRIRACLKNPEIVDDPAILSPEKYVDEVLQNPVNSIIMWNPYNTEWRLKVYREFIARGITPIIGERGALPDTIYFDKGGLCVESDSYQESKWARKLNDTQLAKARTHIERVRFGTEALEKQSGRIGAWRLRQKLGIPDDSRVLLAPLQLYDDTVTKFFSEKGRGYEDYLAELRRLSVSLPKDWVLVYKNHPLSLKKTSFESGLCADAFHINDLLEVCDAVSVFNSGTGLIAQAFEKPVLYYGRCFYAIEGVNWKFETTGTAAAFLKNLPEVDVRRIEQFYYYLNEEFYSFAKMEADTKPYSEHSLRAILKKIDYQLVRIPGCEPKRWETNAFDPYFSPLFDVYRLHEISARKATKAPAPKPASAKPIASAPKPAPAKPVSLPKPALTNSAQKTAEEAKAAKSAKLRRDPHAFFRDAHNPLVRPLRHLFRAR